jgi:Domain of unknown function (DUF4112)
VRDSHVKNTPAASPDRHSPSRGITKSAEPPPASESPLATTTTTTTTTTETPGGSTALQPAAAPVWVHGLVKLMDEAIRIPGTNFRIGWDAIIGAAVPGVGDAASALSHVTLLFFAFRARVPPVVIARMVLNVLVDELWGTVPVIGDLFDAGFRANRKNLDLIEKRGGVQRRTRWVDYLVIGAAIGLVLLIVLLPLILVGFLGGALLHWLKN